MSRFTMIVLLAVSFLGANCAYKKVSYEKSAAVTNESGDAGKGNLSAKMIWLKNKKNRIDVSVNLENNYEFPISMSQDAFFFTIGGKKVAAKSFSGVELRAHTSKDQLLIFEYPEGNRSGEATLVIDPIMGASSEGATKNKLPPLTITLDVPGRNDK